jgi:DNA ligase-associated metallophosphoesterase
MLPDPTLTLGGQTLQFLPERCAFWQEARTLLLADLHLGKAAHLRHHGLPIPEGHTADDLARLTMAIQRTTPRHVIFCGDIFHAPSAQSPAVLELVTAWRATHPDITFTLITGNHDRGRALPPPACGIQLAGHVLHQVPFHFIHDPAHASGPPAITISGHLHPTAALSAAPGRALSAPCFWYQTVPQILVLPAFSTFTAGVPIHPAPHDSIHAIHSGKVSPIPSHLCRRKA